MTITEIHPGRDQGPRDHGSRDQGPAVTFDRTPPQDTAAEQSVLGGMLLSREAIADVTDIIDGQDFYKPAHEIIFDAIVGLYLRGEPADPITVSADLAASGELVRVGGAPYLHSLVSAVPTAANTGYYAKIVAERAMLRRLVEAGTKVVQLGYSGVDGGGEVDDLINEAQAVLYKATETRKTEDYVRLEEILQPTLDEIEAMAGAGAMSGVPTGFIQLDDITNGLHPGQMIIVAARPGVGKSTLALDFARNASIRHGLTSCVFSLEMSRTEIMQRLISAEAQVALKALRTGDVDQDTWATIVRKFPMIASAPMFIDDSPNMTMTEIRSKARRLKQREDLKLIVIDYLQLMQGNRRAESRQQEVSELSRQIKLLAKELEVPIVAISQLNRATEQRNERKPQISDLRESGSLEQDADLVLLLYRPEVYEAEAARPGEADIIIAKHRNGETGSITVGFQGRWSRFTNLTNAQEPGSGD